MRAAFVIGSGIAGLAIAEILSRNNYKVIILESQDKIGGEASLATQKWYHTGWLYAALPNKAAMMGCYDALHLFKNVYGNIFPQNIVNLEITENGVNYLSTHDGWFIDERIHYLYAMSTYELPLWTRIYWPIYLKHFHFNRLKKLNYQFELLAAYDSNMKNLMNQWENDENGHKKYKVIRTTDAKIDTSRVTRSLVSNLSANTEIIKNAEFELMEGRNRTKIKIGDIVHNPDCLVLASGRSIPNHLTAIGFEKTANKIISIKSLILVLKEKLNYPDFIRFTPRVRHTINHITFNVKGNKKISTVGSYYSFPADSSPDISYYENLMCERMGITKDSILGSYYGIKTEFVDGAERRYNHALEKVNQNTFFALAGKFSQFPLLVGDFIDKTGLSFEDNSSGNKFEVNPDLIAHTYPAEIVNNSKKVLGY